MIEKEDEVQHEINESVNFSTGIHEMLIQIDGKLSGLILQTSHIANGSGNGDSSGASSGAHEGAGIYSKLPKLELRNFLAKRIVLKNFGTLFGCL